MKHKIEDYKGYEVWYFPDQSLFEAINEDRITIFQSTPKEIKKVIDNVDALFGIERFKPFKVFYKNEIIEINRISEIPNGTSTYFSLFSDENSYINTSSLAFLTKDLFFGENIPNILETINRNKRVQELTATISQLSKEKQDESNKLKELSEKRTTINPFVNNILIEEIA